MAPMAVVGAFVNKASGAEESGCANMAARNRLALHLSKAVLSTDVQLMVCESLTRGPAMTSCSGVRVAAA